MPKEKSQKEWILDYIDYHGYVIPAEMGGVIWNGRKWPSGGDVRCREMAIGQSPILDREMTKEGFTKFFRKKAPVLATHKVVQGDSLFPIDQMMVRQ